MKVSFSYWHVHNTPSVLQVEPRSLLALFPLSQPPYACVAMAFSRDGVQFSRAVTLTASRLGFRTHRRQLEWRAEDHPVAGAVRAPLRAARVLFYVHHAVKGMSVRDGAVASVARYRMPASMLSRLTRRGLAELERGSV